MNLKKMLIMTFGCVLLFSSSLGGFLIGYKISEKNYYPQSKLSINNLKKAIPAPISSNIIADVAEKAMPWVVNIKMEYENTGSNAIPDQFHQFSPFFDFKDGSQQKMKIRVTGGSGIIIRKDGYVLTNDHVIKNANNIIITLSNGKSYKAKTIGVDNVTDIAVLKIDADNLPVAKLGDSSHLRIGEWIIAVGSPLGYEQTVTQGIVSAINRRVNDIPANVDFIQTDAAINPGNSGGPMINMSGEVIGINTAIRADAQNIGFAIPVNTAYKVAQQLITNGHIDRPWVGIEIRNADPQYYYGSESGNSDGVVISKIWPNSPATKGNLKNGDIIKKIDGKKVKDVRDVQDKVRNHKIGEDVKFDVLRNNKLVRVIVKTQKLPDIKE